MLEWFLHDYRTGDDRKPLIDWFIETQTADYPAEAKEILASWSRSVTGMFRVLAIQDEGQVELYDCLRQDKLTVQDVTLARASKQGDVLIGRLFELSGAKRLSYMTMILPADYEQEMVAYVTNAYNRYVGDHFQATWDAFLREYGHIFMAYLLSAKAESLRSRIGPGTRYADPARARDKLREVTEQRARKRAKEEAEEIEEPLPAEHRTTSGIILPGMAPEEELGAERGEGQARPTILVPGRDF
jgi:hypothetical protein